MNARPRARRPLTAQRTRATLVMALLALAATADAATIYRWVDETGRIHLSDSVPDQYKARATAIDSRQFDIAPAEAAQARARAARDKAQAVAGATPSPSNPSGAMSGNAAPRTALTDAEFAQLDCNTQWKLYRESLECFAPYIQRVPWTAPPEAFQMCTVLKDPSARCPVTSAQESSNGETP